MHATINITYLSTVAPSAPQNFTLATVDGMSTQLQASWIEPDPTNGIITLYVVFCREIGGTMDDNFMVNAGTATMTIVTFGEGLSAYTDYECFVIASTNAGQGEPSNKATARTDEAGKYKKNS